MCSAVVTKKDYNSTSMYMRKSICTARPFVQGIALSYPHTLCMQLKRAVSVHGNKVQPFCYKMCGTALQTKTRDISSRRFRQASPLFSPPLVPSSMLLRAVRTDNTTRMKTHTPSNDFPTWIYRQRTGENQTPI